MDLTALLPINQKVTNTAGRTDTEIRTQSRQSLARMRAQGPTRSWRRQPPPTSFRGIFELKKVRPSGQSRLRASPLCSLSSRRPPALALYGGFMLPPVYQLDRRTKDCFPASRPPAKQGVYGMKKNIGGWDLLGWAHCFSVFLVCGNTVTSEHFGFADAGCRARGALEGLMMRDGGMVSIS